jgi:hypothetical protein
MADNRISASLSVADREAVMQDRHYTKKVTIFD